MTASSTDQAIEGNRVGMCRRTARIVERGGRAFLHSGLVAVLLIGIRASAFAVVGSPDSTVWFGAPAKNFTESCPLGNGRLGAMVFGGVNEERVVLNESSLWSGSRQEADREGAAKALPEIRRLLLEGRNVEAERLVNANFTCKGAGSNHGSGGKVPYGSYQVLGDLRLAFHPSSAAAEASGYHRELDLSQAVTRVQYQQDGVTFTREIFVTAPDQAIVIRLTADQPGRIDFDARLDRPECAETVADGANGLRMSGALTNGAGGEGVRYAARLRVLSTRGQVSLQGRTVQVRKADAALVLVTAATDYRGFAGRNLADPLPASANDLNQAAAKSFDVLRRAHIADYQRYFHRVRLELGAANAERASRPTPARIQAFKRGAEDRSLAVLYFNFSRYLLISSSRPGGLPANLQGLWAEEIQPPWSADWHLDVNVQMNYWPAEVCNLSDLTPPLFALIASLQEPGAKTAREYYGARGWVAHVITNPWGFTSPGEEASWGATTSGSAWLCQHLWDHWLFTRDRQFLTWAYPVMKGSARFYADMLIEEPKHHWLVTAPANSPENAFRLPDGRTAHVCLGPTVDMQLLRYLFGACIEASKTLDRDADFRNELVEKRARLAPTRISSDGRIMEWLEEYPEPEPTHRHISHLWGVYPGDEIAPDTTPGLAAAARQSLDVRGDRSTGWATAYRMAVWARLGDGNRTYKLFSNLLGNCTLPNLFDTHPPFQIDGNFGGAAAVAEMLVQSQEVEIRSPKSEVRIIKLLPALPDAWPEGRVTGLRARGGFQVDVAWQGEHLSSATIHSDLGLPCRVRYGTNTTELNASKGQSVALDANLQRR